MMDSIIAIILSLNITFIFFAITLWVVKKLNHGNKIFSSVAMLFYIRILLIMSLLIGVIATGLHVLLFIPLSTKIKLTFLTLISTIGICLYAVKIINTYSLIYRSPYRREIKHVCIVYSDKMKACSFSLLNKAYVIIPISAVEIYKEHILTLRHEMQHCRQRDGLWNHIIEILGIICWWNPAYQLVKNQNNHIQEICCDQAVMSKYHIRKKEYALTLLKLKNEQTDHKNDKQFKFRQSNVFFERVSQIFYSQTKRRVYFFNWVRMIAISALVAFSSVWSINATADVFIKKFQQHTNHQQLRK